MDIEEIVRGDVEDWDLVLRLLPAGWEEKARELGLAVAEQEESQEICFLPDDDYRGFLRRYAPKEAAAFREGEIVDENGRVLGRHQGLVNYTIGQRRGLGIAHSEPLYVVAMAPEENRLVVGEKSRTYAAGLEAASFSGMGIDYPSEPLRVRAQLRHRHQARPALLSPLGDGKVRVEFDEPQQSPTPGQAVGIYDQAGDWLLGGAWIERSIR